MSQEQFDREDMQLRWGNLGVLMTRKRELEELQLDLRRQLRSVARKLQENSWDIAGLLNGQAVRAMLKAGGPVDCSAVVEELPNGAPVGGSKPKQRRKERVK